MTNSTLHQLFPVPLLTIRSGIDEALLSDLKAYALHGGTTPNSKSGGLSHTAVAMPDDNAAYGRAQATLAPLLSDFGQLLFGEALPWTIVGMWLNVLEHGGQQAIHSHANSFISGVVYLTACHLSARTVFYRGLGGRDFTFSNDHAKATPGPFSSAKWATPALQPGDVVLFPSYLLHEVPKNQGEQRITLAFNAVPARLKSWGYEVSFGI